MANTLAVSGTYFVQAEEAELFDDGKGAHFGGGRELSCHLQPDFHDLQRVGEHHLQRTRKSPISRCGD